MGKGMGMGMGMGMGVAAGLPRTIRELALGYRRRAFSPSEVVRHLIHCAQERRELNCLCWLDAERAIALARKADESALTDDGAGIMNGVPLAVKDNIDTAGVPTTSGSAVRLDRVPEHNAAVWDLLQNRHGAVLLGKANLSEFAYAGPHPHFGAVRNPRNPEHTAGSSSSGSAAAVAADLAPGALGTDTGGSVRVPAAYCGVVGLKPTNGLVSTVGVTPLSWSLDTVGTLAHTVTDVAILFECILPRPWRLIDRKSLELTDAKLPTARIGIARGTFVDALQPEVLGSWKEAARRMEKAGYDLEETAIADVEESHIAHRTILLSEAFAYHAEGIDRGDPYGPDFRAAIEAGRHLPAQAYIDALRWRRMIMKQLEAIFERVPFVLLPTCKTTAPSLAEMGTGKTPATQLTFLANFGGLPAISVPAGCDANGLPIGLQLLGRPHSEGQLLRLALLLEEQMGFAFE